MDLNDLELGRLTQNDISSLFLSPHGGRGGIKLSSGLSFVSIIPQIVTDHGYRNVGLDSASPHSSYSPLHDGSHLPSHSASLSMLHDRPPSPSYHGLHLPLHDHLSHPSSPHGASHLSPSYVQSHKSALDEIVDNYKSSSSSRSHSISSSPQPQVRLPSVSPLSLSHHDSRSSLSLPRHDSRSPLSLSHHDSISSLSLPQHDPSGSPLSQLPVSVPSFSPSSLSWHDPSGSSSSQSSPSIGASSHHSQHGASVLPHSPPLAFIGPFTGPGQAGVFMDAGEHYRSIYNPSTQMTFRTRPFEYPNITPDSVRASIKPFQFRLPQRQLRRP